MGDVIHALPTAVALKRIPGATVSWVIDPKWRMLAQCAADEIIEFDRRDWASLRNVWNQLRAGRFDVAVDVQGLMKSALLARASRAPFIVGFDAEEARERVASLLYHRAVHAREPHVVNKNLEVAAAAGSRDLAPRFPLPQTFAEGSLPSRPFVLACPLAGWRSKQWPIEYYAEVAHRLAGVGYDLVLNGPETARPELESVAGAQVHISGIPGLVYATRQAAAVIGLDSGPLHLAAALAKTGVAIYGPTDPARNGPYGGTIAVLRDPNAMTSYKRRPAIDPSMRAIAPAAVADALLVKLMVGARS
jgi:heptosyltransferase-1